MGKRLRLADVHPELASDWHPARNRDITPDDVSPSWRKPVWWRCNCGHAYQATVHARVRGASCPLCIAANTSAAEQWLFAALREHFPATQHRHQLRVKGGGPVEIDLFIPDLSIAIEYDGPHHHHRVKADTKKNFRLQRAGIQLVRIRQAGLPSLDDRGVMVVQHDPHEQHGLETCLNQLLVWIASTQNTPFS